MSPLTYVLWLVWTLFILSNKTCCSLVTLTGSTVEIHGIPYYVPGQPLASVSSALNTQALTGSKSVGAPWIPVTVVKATSATFNTAALQSTLNSFGDLDDVWNTGFLSVVILVGGASYASNTSTTFSGADVASTVSSLPHGFGSDIPPGPYLLSTAGDLYQSWRLYADTQEAFTQPLIPSITNKGAYSPLPATVPGIASPGIAVPSRLYYVKTSERPLAGVRTGIKDIYDIAGVRTGDGNRAFYDLYPPRNTTALVVQRLIEAGAILVGKMKTSQFANGEVATADWVDYHEPFNPRGDGYQDTSSSSAGAGSGIGSYPWLDLALGSDTGGSIRGPSQVQGIYGNRPTHGIVPLTGAMPLAPELDTAGFLDPAIWTATAKAAYEGLQFYDEYPKTLRTIGFPTPETVATDSTVAQANTILLAFLAKLEAFLGTNATALNYTALWDQTKPDPSLPSLSILLNRTYPTTITKEQTKNVRDPFYADYGAVHDGRLPFVDPVPLVSEQFHNLYQRRAFLRDPLADALRDNEDPLAFRRFPPRERA
ncbi:MAG: hypothetical protein Q9167_007270 [Letrouitia subvulpina]